MRDIASIRNEYERWRDRISGAEDIITELDAMSDDEVTDAFYRDLAFGTGGLRGIIGAGTNRLNVFTVAKASQGLANYVNMHFADDPSIAIAYDSRIKSDVFSKKAASVFAANGIKAYIYPELMPTPCLSYAVRALNCSAGIVITASHNPSRYNGYKVYGHDGCQITTEAAVAILAEIEKIDIFDDVISMPFEKAVEEGLIEYIGEEVVTSFIEDVKGQSVLFGDEIDRTGADAFYLRRPCGYRQLCERTFARSRRVDERVD